MEQLVTETRDRLTQFKHSYTKVAKDTGLSHAWVGKFARGVITNPTVDSLGKIIAWLDQNESGIAE